MIAVTNPRQLVAYMMKAERRCNHHAKNLLPILPIVGMALLNIATDLKVREYRGQPANELFFTSKTTGTQYRMCAVGKSHPILVRLRFTKKLVTQLDETMTNVAILKRLAAL